MECGISGGCGELGNVWQQGSLAGIPQTACLSFVLSPCPSCPALLPRPLPLPVARAVGKERLWQAIHSLCPSLGLGKEAASAPIPQRASRAMSLGEESCGKEHSPPGLWLGPRGSLNQIEILRLHRAAPGAGLEQGPATSLPKPLCWRAVAKQARRRRGQGRFRSRPLDCEWGVSHASPVNRGHRQT